MVFGRTPDEIKLQKFNEVVQNYWKNWYIAREGLIDKGPTAPESGAPAAPATPVTEAQRQYENMNLVFEQILSELDAPRRKKKTLPPTKVPPAPETTPPAPETKTPPPGTDTPAPAPTSTGPAAQLTAMASDFIKATFPKIASTIAGDPTWKAQYDKIFAANKAFGTSILSSAPPFSNQLIRFLFSMYQASQRGSGDDNYSPSTENPFDSGDSARAQKIGNFILNLEKTNPELFKKISDLTRVKR